MWRLKKFELQNMFWNLNFKKQKNYNMWKNQMKGKINIDVFLMPTRKWNKKLKKKKLRLRCYSFKIKKLFKIMKYNRCLVVVNHPLWRCAHLPPTDSTHINSSLTFEESSLSSSVGSPCIFLFYIFFLNIKYMLLFFFYINLILNSL